MQGRLQLDQRGRGKSKQSKTFLASPAKFGRGGRGRGRKRATWKEVSTLSASQTRPANSENAKRVFPGRLQKPFPFPGNRRDQLRASRVYKHGSHRPSMFKAKFKLKLLHPPGSVPPPPQGGNNNFKKGKGEARAVSLPSPEAGKTERVILAACLPTLGPGKKLGGGGVHHHHYHPPPSPSARSGRGRPPPLTGLEERNRSSLSLAHSPGRCKRREGRKARSGPASRCLQEMTQAAKEAEEAPFPSTGFFFVFSFTCFAAGAA